MLLRAIINNITNSSPRCLFRKDVHSFHATTKSMVCRRLHSDLLPTLTLYSKSEGCSLCDDAKESIFKHGEKFHYEEVDITAVGNEVWYELYKYDIPVVHINNMEVMKHRVFEEALIDALHNAKSQMNS